MKDSGVYDSDLVKRIKREYDTLYRDKLKLMEEAITKRINDRVDRKYKKPIFCHGCLVPFAERFPRGVTLCSSPGCPQLTSCGRKDCELPGPNRRCSRCQFFFCRYCSKTCHGTRDDGTPCTTVVCDTDGTRCEGSGCELAPLCSDCVVQYRYIDMATGLSAYAPICRSVEP